MKFLLDANLSPKIVARLRNEGYDAAHVADLELLTATDEEILDRAEIEGCVLVTADTDFPMLVAMRGASRPSVLLLRAVSELPPERHADLVLVNLPTVTTALERGAIVSLRPDRLRIRELPITAAE